MHEMIEVKISQRKYVLSPYFGILKSVARDIPDHLTAHLKNVKSENYFCTKASTKRVIINFGSIMFTNVFFY
ncbi:hypothetical protein DJ95_4189 [Bacillus atrophaeus subsp. globigii]|nr:hypothetical protein DJ95_4189 [Bacillus atrophaeus subsp. globigii]EIM09580.1 hypothetical protein UY9_16886 [Bacillus atrophaeus C89]